MERNRSSSRLKQRLARLFRPSSLLRSTCNTSSSAATVISSTASSRTLLRDVSREPVFVPRRHRRRFVDDDDGMFSAHDSPGRCLSFSVANDCRHVAPVLPFSVDCGGCRPTRDIPPLMAKSEKGRHGKNRKKERRVRETGGFYETGEGEGRMCPPTSPSSLSKSSYYYYYCFNEVEKEDKREEKNEKKQKKKKKKKKLLLSNSYGFSSSSSVDSDDEFEFFTSEEREGKEEETETFFSSRSFSSDSTEFYQRPLPNANKKKNKKRPSRCPPRRRSRNRENRNHASEGFQPLVSVAPREKKVRELEEEEKRGFAVVKRSSDPYGDFRSSMVEMIMERQIFGSEDLEKLLHSYLSLNSSHHHPCILQAFSDIWAVLFGN